MTVIDFIQYGEPAQRQSARIPCALWEENKSQIINLFENHTLDQVMEKMAEAGFAASRRQYVYQLGQWRISKYKVKPGKPPGSKDTSNNKRSHTVAEASHDENQHLTLSHPTPSNKRPRVTIQSGIGTDEGIDNKPAADDFERSFITAGLQRTASTSIPSQFIAQSRSSAPTSSKSPAQEFLELLERSISRWILAPGDFKIAREISLSAKKVRSQPKEERARTFNDCDIENLYLKDIGDYLCGMRCGEEAFDIYALILENPIDFCWSDNIVILLPCVRSADSPEACQWVASFLQKYVVAPETDRDTLGDLVLAHLLLACKLGRYGLCIAAEKHVIAAFQLMHRYDTSWGILNSIQDWYFSEIEKKGYLSAKELSESTRYLWRDASWSYSLLAKELDGLRFYLLIIGNTIIERMEKLGLNAATGEEEEEGTEKKTPLSAILFQLIQGRVYPLPGRLKWHFIQLLDFEGTCCELIAHEIIQHQQRKSPTTSGGDWMDSLRDLDLVGTLGRKDASELHSNFVRAYCARDSGSRSVQLSEVWEHKTYFCGVHPTVINLMATGVGVLETRAYIPEGGLEELGSLPTISWTGSIKPPQEENRVSPAGAGAGAGQLSKMSTPTSFQPRLVPRSSSIDKRYLDPTLGSPCRSSLASYGHMIEARAAMARSRKRIEQDKPGKGAGGSLPSKVLGMEELSVSMGSVSLQDL